MKLFVCALMGLFALAAIADAAPNKVVCYFGSWSVYRPGEGKFDVEDIDPFLCTHLMFGFVGLEESGNIKVLDPWNELYDDWGKGAFIRFTNLKKTNPNLKTLVAMGGWNEGSIKYSQTFRDPNKIANFVTNAVNFITKYGFDGLDVDWEYPNKRGGEPIDVQSFTNLLQALRTEFDKYGYLLTAAVHSAEISFTQSYDVPRVSQLLDFINVMAYDYHGAWDNVTGHNAPFAMAAVERGTADEGYNFQASVQAWLKHGAAPEKLVMGMGLYGRGFVLASSACTQPRCPNTGASTAGPYTREAGFMGYNEICVIENDPATQKYWDAEANAAYIVFNNQWIGYDDERSFRLKADYIKQYGLGGGMVWSIETDDFHGKCGKGRSPLLNILKSVITGGGSVPPATTTPAPTAAPTTTTSAPVTTTTSAPATTTTSAPATTTTSAPATTTTSAPATTTTSAPASGVPETEFCKYEGYNRDPNNCGVFYQCYVANGEYKYSKFTCASGTSFDLNTNTCDFTRNVDCS